MKETIAPSSWPCAQSSARRWRRDPPPPFFGNQNQLRPLPEMPRIFSFRLQCGRPNAAITFRRKSSATRTRITRRCSGGTGDTALAIGVNERSSGLDDDRNVTLSLLFGWPIMLPERMCAGRAPSSGKAGGHHNCSRTWPHRCRPERRNEDYNPGRQPNTLRRLRLELCKSKHSSVALLQGSRLQRLQSRESRRPANNALHLPFC